MSSSSRIPFPGRAAQLSAFLILSLVSNLGTWMHAFAEQWAILLLAGPEAARWAGRQSLAFGLAMLVCLPFGGSLADRFEPRKVLGLTQMALLSSALGLGVLACRHGLTLHRLLAFATFAGLASALSMPAAWGVLRQVSPPDRPEAGTPWFTFQYDLSRMAAPALAALVLPVAGVAGSFFLNALSFGGMVGFCACLGPSATPAAEVPRRREPSYRELAAWVRRDPELRTTLALAACFGLLAWNQVTLMPVYATRYLHLGAPGLASLLTALGLGALGASLAMVRGQRWAGRKLIPVCFGLYGALLVLWGVHPQRLLAYGTCLVIGPTQALLWLLLNARTQRLAPPHLVGRTTAVFLTLTMGLMPLGTWLAGEGAQLLGFQGPRWVLGLDGLLLAGVALGGLRLGRLSA